MKIKKNDTVLIISGKDRGKTGKVLNILPEKNKIVVEGVNLRKKNVRPKKSGEKGQIIQITAPLDSSNAKVICGKCGKASRMGYKINGDTKNRICKKCNQAQ